MCAVFFFFFQAEDGIRDRDVTGVQTCALPISPVRGGGGRTARRRWDASGRAEPARPRPLGRRAGPMTALPAVPPSVAADAVDALPTRLRRKLDDLLPAARAWPVTETPEGYAVIVDADTVVTLCRVVTTAEDLRCGCLLAPRCLHRAAVASLAPTAEDAGPAGDAGPAAAPAPAEAPTAPPVTPVEAAAATALWDAAVAVLLTGIPGAGAVPQAVLLRAAHEARGARLPRGASAAIRVVEHLRAAHRDD